jgi:hypothetical protein
MLDVQDTTEFAAINESPRAQELKKISVAGIRHGGSVFLVEQTKIPTGVFLVSAGWSYSSFADNRRHRSGSSG